jgi:F-type H+-transporting ATPase subunit epsilon
MLKLEIVTPEKRVLDAEVDSVTVPTASGEAGILPHHAPLISALRPGVLSYSSKGNTEKLVVTGGFVEVNADKVAILADAAEMADEIDVAAAQTAKETAERALAAAASASMDDNQGVRDQLDAANVRLQLAAGR